MLCLFTCLLAVFHYLCSFVTHNNTSSCFHLLCVFLQAIVNVLSHDTKSGGTSPKVLPTSTSPWPSPMPDSVFTRGTHFILFPLKKQLQPGQWAQAPTNTATTPSVNLTMSGQSLSCPSALALTFSNWCL